MFTNQLKDVTKGLDFKCYYFLEGGVFFSSKYSVVLVDFFVRKQIIYTYIRQS